MSPESALRKQIELYRQMTGEERMAIGFRLHELACNMAREGIRSQHPNATAHDVEAMLRRRIELARRQ